MKILLDTSGYVGFKCGTEEVVDSITSAEAVLFSPVVLGELMFGFRNGNRFKENMDELNKFLEHKVVEIIHIGKTTSDRYSRISLHLKRQGTPIPSNDIWIAAQGIEHGVELITSDRHFENIAGLIYTIF
jgi:tRNA(fMet)-specific endonuclease VapC